MKPLILFFSVNIFFINTILSQPVILIKGGENAHIIKELVTQFMEHLNITENVHLTVNFTKNVPENMKGITFCLDSPTPGDYHHIVIWLDTSLSKIRRQIVLAHEMIHVKQYAKGELTIINRERVVWKGKPYRAKTYNRSAPWELEAFRDDKELLEKYDAGKFSSPAELVMTR